MEYIVVNLKNSGMEKNYFGGGFKKVFLKKIKYAQILSFRRFIKTC